MNVRELRECLEKMEAQGKGDLMVMTKTRLQDFEDPIMDVAPLALAHLTYMEKTPWSKEAEIVMLDVGPAGLIGMYM